jgi:ferric-dicitrate binding protein FerR (iron transport regulator)
VNASLFDEFEELAAAVVDGSATGDDVRRFNAILREVPELAEVYFEQAGLHALLCAAGEARRSAAGGRKPEGAIRQKPAGRVWWRIAAAAALLLFGVAAMLWKDARPLISDLRSLTSVPPVRLVRQAGAAELELPATLPGTLRLDAGTAWVHLASGVELTLLGPLELEVRDAMRVRLASGRLLVEVPPVAAGFTVVTPGLEMWDIGTVFGVSVSDGVSDMFVFKGEVQVNEASGDAVDLCRAGEGVREESGRHPFKISADWPEARRLFAAVRGRAALADPAGAFGVADKIAGMWMERYEPRVAPPRPKTIARAEPTPSENKEETEMRHLAQAMATMALGAVTLGSAITADAQVIIDDPLAYWDFESGGGFLANRVTPGPYHDASALLGQPASGLADGASGIVGNALLLDGVSAIRLPYHQDNLGRSFTVSLWYWQLTNDTRQCVYQTRDNYTATYETSGAHSTFSSYVGQQAAGNITTGLKEWIHLAHTFSTAGNTTTLSVYTNGVLRFTKSVDADNMFGTNQVRGLHVGATRSVTLEGGRCFKGMIDELALWGRALSAAEVQAVYQRGAGGQQLAFTARDAPSISLAGGQLAFSALTDGGLPEGLFQSGWLVSGGTGLTGIVPDTARAAEEEAGSIMPETAGHAEGPFNAEKIAAMRWRVPLTAGSALKRLPQGDFTAEAWFRTTSTEPNVLFGTYPGGGAGVVNLQLEVNSQAMLYWRNAAGLVERVQVTPPVNLRGRGGSWHHLAGVRNGATAYLYMDGVRIGTTNVAAGAFDLGGSHLYIGQDGRGNFGLFNGEIGTARLWTRALDTNEVAGLAAFGIPGVGAVSRDGLLAEYAPYRPFNAVPNRAGWRIAFTPQLRQIPQTNFTYEVAFRTTDAGRGILLGNYGELPDGSLGTITSLELFTGNEVRFHQWGNGYNHSTSRSTGSVNFRDGALHRLAAVRRGGQTALYLDGQQLGADQPYAGTGYAFREGNALGLGRDFRSPGLPLNGDIASARIWSRALSADELAGLAASNAVPAERLIAQYAPASMSTLRTAGFPGGQFLRSYGIGTNTATLVFTGLPRHTKIGIGLLLAQLDLLDPQMEGDRFAIKVDGTEALRVGLGPAQGNEPQISSLSLFGTPVDAQAFGNTLTLGGQDLFGCGGEISYNDHVYDLSLLEPLQGIPHTSGTLTLEFLGIQNMGGENEGFGIDNIRLTVYPPKGTLVSIR